jgi:hypothetical protein
VVCQAIICQDFPAASPKEQRRLSFTATSSLFALHTLWPRNHRFTVSRAHHCVAPQAPNPAQLFASNTLPDLLKTTPRTEETMDVKEVDIRGRAISKAIAAGDPPSTLLKLLNDLKQGMKASEELLRTTRIGITVNKLRTHKDQSVASLATSLVTKWREDVNREKRSAAGHRGAVAAKVPNGATPPASASASPAPTKAKKHSVDPTKRNHKTDKVTWQVTGNTVRDNCVKLMYDGLAHMSEDCKCHVLHTAR